jgi:phage/plasmid-associated DNA primase
MATTIAQLIEHLKTEDQNATVVFQYVLAEHTDWDEDDFEDRATLLDSSGFPDESASYIKQWLADIVYVREEEEEEEE